MKIVIDLDSTIINTSKTLLNIYNQETNSNIKYNPNHKWDFDGLFPKSYNKRAFELFTEEKFYDFVEPIYEAVEVINSLAIENDILIVTKHHPLRIPNTQKWINSNFKNVKIEYVSSFDKSSFYGNVFIDDRIDCLNSVKENFKCLICFGSYDWNREWTGLRFDNWNKIKDFINGGCQLQC